jgi:putative transposase
LMRWQILRRHIEDGVPLTTLAAHEGIGLRTLQRWHAAHKRDGISGPVTVNRGTTHRRTIPELIALVGGLALVKPPLPIAAIARKANRVAADRDWPPISYSTVRSITTGLDSGMRTLAQQGTAAYRDTYKPPNRAVKNRRCELTVTADRPAPVCNAVQHDGHL